MKPESGRKVIATNKDAHFRYLITEKVEAGISLLGTEVKSIRSGKVQMSDAYVFFIRGEAYLQNLQIPEYSHGNRENHLPLRDRKLLLHRRQIDQLSAAVNEQGYSLIPLQMYFDKGRVKVELGLGKGKKTHDKRASIKEKESKREIARALKQRQ